MIGSRALIALTLAAVLAAVGVGTAHSLPKVGDRFQYAETISLTNGQGNYSGYSETQFLNASYSVGSVASNGTALVNWQSKDNDVSSLGEQLSSDAGSFTFSPSTLHYVNGTDNQTGYVDPYVWFYVNNSLVNGSSFYLLNTRFQVQSTDAPFAHPGGSTGWVRTIAADGTGTYQRNDAYGAFTASYDWKVYFDPATGYIVGYVYIEQDNDGNGDGFTWTDTLAVTSTSYALTATAAPPPPPPAPPAIPWALLIGAVVLVLVVVLIVVLVTRRRRSPMPRHSVEGAATFGPPGAAPPPLNFGSVGQPAVQQIVIKETVKTKCPYCGMLMDTTATVCPKCGAPRT